MNSPHNFEKGPQRLSEDKIEEIMNRVENDVVDSLLDQLSSKKEMMREEEDALRNQLHGYFDDHFKVESEHFVITGEKDGELIEHHVPTRTKIPQEGGAAQNIENYLKEYAQEHIVSVLERLKSNT